MAVRACALAVLALASIGAAHAQVYPNRPIRAIVPIAPGGGTDTTGRLVLTKLSDALGQQIVVDNRAGGGGTIGAMIAAKALPDGYTFLFGSISTHAVNPAMYKKLPYDHIKDFAPVARIGTVPNVLVVHPALPVKTVGDLINHAKANPGKINYGSAGIGSPPHLSMELFKSITGVNILHVPYKGAGPALAELLGGQTQVMCTSLAGQLPHIKAGRVRALAVTTAKRNAQVPDVPTMIEAGVPGYEVTIWYAVFFPAGAPKAVIARLNSELVKILNGSDMKERMAQIGVDPAPSTPEELAAFVKAETIKYTKVAQDAGIKLE
ncbi:MAG: LacI family transcriptional regulator [Betaproteobacteria bacterium RIFCSPLOWO2_12_FULL_62_58]|nr:MAG: LacI family transcriptional regulator [Betaproteobacteria bacterium RIFCSPLOWO2_12_FULL_62_58]